MSKWITVAKEAQLPLGKSKIIEFATKNIAVFNANGKFYAIANACPHQGGPLGQGELDGEVIQCPWHDWKYNIKTGCAIATPSIKTYKVRVYKKQIQILIENKETLTPDNKFKDVSHEIIEQIQLGKTLDEVFINIYNKLQKVVPHNRLGLALIDEVSGKLVQVKTISDSKILLDNGFSGHIKGSSLEKILQLGEARIIDDLERHFAKRPSIWTKLIIEEGMRSSLTLPLKVHSKPTGVVFFTSINSCAFSETHVGFLKQITGQLSILIEKGRWISELTQSHERYRILFEMSNDAIFICPSLQDPFLSFNNNLCKWLGYDHQQLSKLSFKDLVVTKEWQYSNFSNSKFIEVNLLKKNGDILPLELRLASILHQNKTFVQGIARDLSEIVELNKKLQQQHTFEGIIGKNRKMQEIYQLIEQLGPMSSTVLVQGESGTGKERIAIAIHRHSSRKEKPFIAVNCGALSENLLESELFGHIKGAFTGATTTRQGRFEIANGGSIFLDEIGEISAHLQVKLLRVLQEGEFEKVGDSATLKVNVRIIAATNCDLKKAIAAGTFREDLYYRLNVIPIKVPPLRERRDDIPLLVRYFIGKFKDLTQKNIRDISPEALDVLLEYSYPGNVRELENIIEHAFVKCQGETVEKANFPEEMISPSENIIEKALKAQKPLEALEKELIKKVVEQYNGRIAMAAKHLGISRVTLWRKMTGKKS